MMPLLLNALSRFVITFLPRSKCLSISWLCGWRSLVGCSPWGHWGSGTTEWLHFHFSLSCIGEGNGNPLQCSCLENPRDGGAWWAAVYGVAQSQTWLKRLSSSSSWPFTYIWKNIYSYPLLIFKVRLLSLFCYWIICVSNRSKRPSCWKVLLSYLPFYFSEKLFLGKLVFWVSTVFQYFPALSTLH